MGNFLLISSTLYLLGALWYICVDRRDKHKVVLIPTEFIYVIATGAIVLFFLKSVREQMIFYSSHETRILAVAAIIGFLMLCIHGIAKNLDDRHNLSKLSKSNKNIIRMIHLRFSHQVIYLSLIAVLLTFALGEINNTIVITELPKIKIVSLSALIFALAFYRNLIHGNTWGTEIIAIPLAVFLLASNCYRNNIFLTQYPLVYFSLLTLVLTFVFLVISLLVNRYKMENRL